MSPRHLRQISVRPRGMGVGELRNQKLNERSRVSEPIPQVVVTDLLSRGASQGLTSVLTSDTLFPRHPLLETVPWLV